VSSFTSPVFPFSAPTCQPLNTHQCQFDIRDGVGVMKDGGNEDGEDNGMEQKWRRERLG
jgi:hypothetical protein